MSKTFIEDIKDGEIKDVSQDAAILDAHTDAATAQSEVDALEGVVATGTNDAGVKIAKVALIGGLANAIAFAWQNPETVPVLVQKVLVDITTEGATATAVMDIGIVANATATADTIIDGLPVTAKIIADSITDKGSNGTGRVQKMDAKDGANDYITGKILVADAAALAGTAYVEYVKLPA